MNIVLEGSEVAGTVLVDTLEDTTLVNVEDVLVANTTEELVNPKLLVKLVVIASDVETEVVVLGGSIIIIMVITIEVLHLITY